MLKASDLASARWWNVGVVADSMIHAYYPLNGALKGVPYLSGNDDNWPSTVGSFHPGGANVGFCDGSVRFVKDSIQSLPYDPSSGTIPAFLRDSTSGTFRSHPVRS